MQKPRYRFLCRDNKGQYHWEAVNPVPGDGSRSARIECSVAWFWRPVEQQPETEDEALRRQLRVWRAEYARTHERAALARVRIIARKLGPGWLSSVPESERASATQARPYQSSEPTG